MSNLLSRLSKRGPRPDSEQFCFQVNKDEMLFFPTREKMMDYLRDYQKKIPIYKLSMFKVQFFQIR